MATDVCTASKDNIILNAIFNPHTPYCDILCEESSETFISSGSVVSEVSEELLKREIDGVKAAQKGELQESLKILNALIKEAPFYASGYNNRAQVFRIQGDNDLAMADLNKAISLSNGVGLAASQAYVQRGLLQQLQKEDAKALEDFEAAAKLGNTFAKSKLVAMNPYAALCNHMLGEVFSRIYNGEEDLK